MLCTALRLFLAAAACIFSSTAMADQQDVAAIAVGSEQEPASYVIGPQNVIQIKIFGDASSNQIYRVDERGYIKHALLGSINIGGMTVAEAEKLIEGKLTGDYFVDPRVTLFILEHSHFSVLGEVRKAGTYEILGRTSVIEAISMAGGFTPVANQKNVKIIRKMGDKEDTIELDTTRITDHGETSANVNIQADDVVVISKSFF